MSRILVVDDRQENRDLLKFLLEKHHYVVDTAIDGTEALSRARQSLPQLIICALLMPVDGSVLLRGWKADQQLKQIPFMVYSRARIEPQEEKRALDLGADAVIATPVESEVLIARVRQVLAPIDAGTLKPRAADTHHITQRNQAEEERLEIFERITDAFVTLDKNWHFTYVNTKAAQMFGRRPEDLVGKHLWTEFPEGVGQDFQLIYEKAMAEQQMVFVEEYYHPPLDRWFENRIYPSPEGLAIYFREVTERKRMQTAMRDSEAKFSAAFRSSPMALTIITLEGDFAEANQAFCDLLGYRREQLIGRSVVDVGIVSMRDGQHLLASIDGAGGSIRNAELQVCVRDGSVLDIVYSVTPISLNGALHRLFTGADITQRKQAEERVRRLNRTYTVLSSINQLIVREREPQIILDGACRIAVEQGRFLMSWIGLAQEPAVRLRTAAHAGATADTLEVLERISGDSQLGCAFTSQAMETDAHAVCNDIAHDPRAASWAPPALQRGYRAMVSLPLTASGRRIGVFNLYAADAGFFDAEEVRLLGELACDIAFALDGCAREQERQRALDQLRASEERFRELAETIEDVFWITEPAKQRLIYVSPGYERIWGRTCRSLYDAPRSWTENIHLDDREQVRQAAAFKQTAGTFDEEYRIVRPDGQLRWIRDRAFPVRNAAGQIERMVGVARDITERRQLGEQLRQSQKMEAIGQLAGGIAHDFNNLLGTIIGNAELVRMDLAGGHAALESIQEILRAGQRAKELVQRILTFSRPQDHQLRPLKLGPVVHEAVRLLRSTLPAGVELTFHDASAAPAVRADASQIHQIVLNLATNAWHAMQNSTGRIRIDLEACEIDNALHQARPELQPGSYVCLSVSDDGTGMDAVTVGRIFEPFFTTKPPGQGTGLGLSVVHGIMRSHGGTTLVESHPGRGSMFHLYFPASAEQAVPTIPETLPSAELRGRGEHILYLDDEEPLVYLCVRLLERLGFRVTGHTRAAEALAAFRADPRDFDLIITDLNMPGMSGLDVARQLLSIDPDAAIVLASGYLRPAEVEYARSLGIREIILKPNTVEELGPVVTRLLSSRRSASAAGTRIAPYADFGKREA